MKSFIAFLWLSFFALTTWAQPHAEYKRTEDVIYGRKYGTALTMDVFQPAKPNGAGIIYVVSGGWFSSHDGISVGTYQEFLDRGYTVFAVVHGSQPKFIIPEIIQDMARSVRFIRHNAAQYGVDPKRLGVVGGSAGGHLSLVLGTQTDIQDMAKSKDPIDRESSAVQCVACFFPPTDFLNYGTNSSEGDGVGILKNFKSAFGSESDTEEGRQKLGREISPIYYVTSNMPPTLIFHGDADSLVPIQQSQTFVKKSVEAGAVAKLVVVPGKGHGWPDLVSHDIPLCADWFDAYLRGINK